MRAWHWATQPAVPGLQGLCFTADTHGKWDREIGFTQRGLLQTWTKEELVGPAVALSPSAPSSVLLLVFPKSYLKGKSRGSPKAGKLFN